MHCWGCGISPHTSWLCNGCDKATYCGEACQSQHWMKRHQFQCLISGKSPSSVDFYVDFFNGHEEILGRGGRGIAFINPDFPDIVVKKANNVDTCRGNNEEYKTIVTIGKALNGLSFGLVSLIKVHNYMEDDFLQCYVVTS